MFDYKSTQLDYNTKACFAKVINTIAKLIHKSLIFADR